MKKSLIATALALGMLMGMGPSATLAVPLTGMFCMFDAAGAPVSDVSWGTVCDEQVTGDIDVAGGTFSVASPQPFFGINWAAHNGTTFAPGTYTFDTIQGGVYTGVVVGAAQTGGHILFDWSSSTDIDVVNVWDISCTNTTCTYTSTDVTAGPGTGPNTPVTAPDGTPGLGMIDGPFVGFHANFNFITPAPPTANDDSVGTTTNTAATVNVIANDFAAANGDSAASTPPVVTGSNPPNSAVTLTAATSTQGGTLVNNGDGTITYTPPGGFTGADDFSYTLTDGYGLVSAAATVNVTVSAVANQPPVANDTSVSTNEDTPLAIDVNTVASDPDPGDSITFATFDSTSAQGGTITANGGNTVLTYTPAANFNGTDTFTFSVTDGTDNSNVATITVTVNPVNDPVVCTDVTLTTGLDTPLDISVANDLLSTCSDPDGDTISLVSTTQPTQSGSMLASNGAGTLTYTPATGFTGQDSFTYTATDGTSTDTRTVFINVAGKIFGNFTMLDGDGVTFGGTNDIVFTWDNTCYNSVAEADAGPANMTMGSDSSFPFFGFPWFAHDIKVFCPGGPYVFDTCNPGVTPPDCGDLSMTVPAGHLGAHILFNWNITDDIDVAIVWNNSTGGMWQNVVPTGQLYQGPTGPTPALDEFYDWISVDADGDGVPGIQFTDGPFINFRANFNFKTSQSGGGTVTAPKSSIQSPNLGSTAGCTLSHTPVNPLDRSGWLVIAGLAAWLGFGRQCRRQVH